MVVFTLDIAAIMQPTLILVEKKKWRGYVMIARDLSTPPPVTLNLG